MKILTDNDITNQPLQGRYGRGRQGYKPELIVLHIQDGVSNPHDYFSGADADSTMWISRAGQVVRYLEDTDTAWTNGAWTITANTPPSVKAIYDQINPLGLNSNVVSLTVENEGYPTDTMPQAQYDSLIGLIAYWCQKWGIPADRDHIIGHYQLGEHLYCPGPIIENHWTQIIKDVQTLMQTPPPNVDPTPTPNAFVVGQGVLAAMAAVGDTPQTNEQYCKWQTDNTVLSLTWGVKYLYVYDSRTDKVTHYAKS